MHRALVLIWGFIFAISTSAYGQENFTVSGEISFQEEKGQLCVWLRNQDEHDLYLKPAAPARSLIIIPNQQQLQAKKVTFKFVAVPKGFYCIFCFQDLNGNGKQYLMARYNTRNNHESTILRILHLVNSSDFALRATTGQEG